MGGVAEHDADIAAITRVASVPTILDIVCRTTGMGYAAVARVTEDRWIACSVKDDIAFGLEPGGELKIETTICNEVRQMREPVIIDNVAESDAYRDHATPALYGFQSYISVPIVLADGTFFGTLCAIDPKPAKLATPGVIGMFTLFAELIAFHLDSLDKVAASEARLVDERETSALREEFIAVLGHDLRNPLAAIQSGAHLLNREIESERGRNILSLMHESVSRMAGMVDDVLDFARGRLGGGISLTRSVREPLQPLLEQVVMELRASHSRREIIADIAVPDKVDCDRSRIGQLFSNLLGNALTHGAPGQPVKARAATDGTMFELSVSNAGAPIPPAAMERLFAPFVRGEVRPNQKGLGLGLYIASEIARAHGGRIDVRSDADETRFTFRMPLVSN